MPLFRSLVIFLASSSLALAEEPVKLRTLSGSAQEGELVSISDKEITLRGQAGLTKTPLSETLDLTLPYKNSLPSENYSDVELTDGSILHCPEVAIKGSNLECKLGDGHSVKIGLVHVASILKDAQDPKMREEWKGILSKRGNLDQLAVKDSEGKLNALEGTFGNGDEKGSSIEFESASGVKRQVNLGRIQAMSFVRKLNSAAAPIRCKVIDVSDNAWMAAELTFADGRFRLKTAAGVQVDFPQKVLSHLNYGQSNVTYLSDLEPAKVVESSNVEAVEHYRRDRNLDNGPLQLTVAVDGRAEAQTFAKGLALHATTEIVYDIGGQYKEFKALVGVDPAVGGDSQVRLTVLGDGRELFAADIRRGDDVRKLNCDVKNVRELRVTVRPAGFLDLGNHVNLADARLIK
jgi:NPCBM/NEW2 domain